VQRRETNGGRKSNLSTFIKIQQAGWKRVSILAAALVLFAFAASVSFGATFTNNASIQVTSDPSGSLTSASGIFTVSCWFRISVPSSATISDNMDILMDRSDGNEGANFSYLLRYNYINNAVEFVTKGSSASYSRSLIQNPYLERWYHVAVIHSGAGFTFYVDGLPLGSQSGDSTAVGSTTGSGLSIGGVNGNSKQFSGDIVEMAIYSQALNQSLIQGRMFQDQRNFTNLKGYYKLGYSTNASDFYHNFVTNPPAGTDPASAVGSGTITFSQVDEAGEQSLFDANLNHGADALTPLSGAFAWQQTAFARPTPGIGYDFEYGYSSALPTQAPQNGSSDPYDTRILGPRWRTSFDVCVAVNNSILNQFNLITWDGAVQTWTRTNLFASFSNRDKEYRGELVQLPTSEVQWTTPQRIVYLFRDPTDGTPMAGKLEQISDFNNNVVQLNWDEDNAIITSITDTAGGVYQFNYDSTRSLLTNITFGAWQVNFAYDSTNRLISKSIANTAGLYTAANTTWQFGYNTNGLLQQIIDPRGNTNILVLYDQYGRQTNLVDAVSRTTRIEYDVPATWQMRRTDPGGFQWVETYDHKGHVLSQNDPLNNTTSYTYDTNGNRTSITEPLGWTTTFGYDSRANVLTKTNALGEITSWAYHPFFNKAIQQITQQPAYANSWTTWTNNFAYDGGGNLTNNFDALGSLVNYTYSTNGLVLSSMDANGHTTSFTYDTNGFLLSKTDAATNTTTYTPNDVGWKLHEYDALGNPTSYTYDLNGNQTRIQDVLGRVFNKVYDGDGNLLSTTDGKGQLTTYAYDAANQKTNMIDRTGTNNWKYFYTTCGKLDHVTDALGYSATNIYDSANRLISVIDPLGQSITNQYDNNGNLVAFFDKLGQRRVKTYDRLNRVISEADPLGDTRTTSFDVADRVQQITSPNGYPSTHAYDGRGRLTKWVDPQNFSWLYAYDGVGNITNITDALGGHYLMAYGPRNERTMEQNQDTNIWQYTYDELLRLKQQTDPNGTVRTPTYDNAGRVLFVDFNTGRRDSFNYDNNDNPVSISRRFSGVTTALQLIYDSLDRVVEQDDALGKTVLYGHDPLGRVTSITYPGGKVLTNGYDALGRLTRQVDWAGRQMNYAYDPADRLIYRSYPNGVVQTNTFDTAGRIAALSYAPSTLNSNSINTALTYAYDRNGNKTGSSESGVFNWPLPSLTDDNTGYTPAGKLINRQIQNNSATSNQVSTVAYHYDSSGNLTNAVMTTGGSTAQIWTLTYDEDNRTTSIYWQVPPLTSRMVTNRYDVMGRRISKTVDGVTTGYVLLLAGGMEKVLCDLDGNGNVTAWYVHGPDLCYRVDSTNGLLCYHADAMGNIIALTDGNTNLVAQYAYTPYGRSLGSTNLLSTFNSQSYTFVGSQGVQEESGIPNLYFMRARYYSADAGVFLSTEPIKHIGASWKPIAFAYGYSNPVKQFDPTGTSPLSIGLDLYGIGDDIIDANEGRFSLVKYGEDYFSLAVDVLSIFYPAEFVATSTLKDLNKVNEIVGTTAGSLQIASDAITGSGIAGSISTGVANSIANSTFGGPQSTPATYNNPNSGGLNGSFASKNGVQLSTPSLSQYTATVATPQASAVTAASSTKPSSASGGGTTSGGGGGIVGPVAYTVRPGDTLGNIGSQYGSSATAIGQANNIANLNIIHPGQVLIIPSGHR
jgi:RHS repeat-associated protein